jgi:DUF2946 family protein
MRRLRRHKLGVWLGVLAIVVYAWLPHHFAADVVNAALHAETGVADAAHEHTGSHHGHAHDPADHGKHAHHVCPICAAAAASAGPVAGLLPVLAAPLAPRAMGATTGISVATAPLTAIALTPYAPRGPPHTA